MGGAVAQRLMQAFADRGIFARFVGGCVRDAILGVAAHDIDMAVPIPPDDVITMLTQAGIKCIPTGYDFGTITAVVEGQSFQITSLREDWETDGRHARVTYGVDWKADALRRDFTINALYAERDGTVLDYCGGLQDLQSGVIRFVGDAHQRIREDYLRILRYFRFLAWYGHGPVNAEAIQACTGLACGLEGLSRERIGHEFLKLLTALAPLPSLALMEKTGVAPFVLPHSFNFVALETLLQLEKVVGVAPCALRRLAALSLPHIDEEGLAKALRLSGKQKQYLFQCRSRLGDYLSAEGDPCRNLYRDGAGLFQDLTMLSVALQPLSRALSSVAQAVKISQTWIPPSFPVKGKDLVKMGIRPGVKLGFLLKRCEEWWIEQDFQPDREACLRWIWEQD